MPVIVRGDKCLRLAGLHLGQPEAAAGWDRQQSRRPANSEPSGVGSHTEQAASGQRTQTNSGAGSQSATHDQ